MVWQHTFNGTNTHEQFFLFLGIKQIVPISYMNIYKKEKAKLKTTACKNRRKKIR